MNMQHIIDENLIKYLSFPDYLITNFQFFPEKKELRIDIERAWLDINSGIPLGPGFLFFRNWTFLTIREFDGKTWQNLEFSELDILEEINEFTMEDTIICFSGSAKKTHKWIEWRVENPEIMAQFYDLRPYALNILLDKYVANEEKIRAAISLHRFEDGEVVQVLAQVASDPTADVVLIKYSADSLGEIFSKGNLYDQELIEKLTPKAREIVYDIIRNKNPSLLKSS